MTSLRDFNWLAVVLIALSIIILITLIVSVANLLLLSYLADIIEYGVCEAPNNIGLPI